MDVRNEAFQRLKPVCVPLSQAAMGLMGNQGDLSSITSRLHDLVEVLNIPIVRSALDEKLADYVFFPLSNVLRHLEKLPVRARERTFEAISILLKTAWKQDINPQLGIQLMILLSFVLDIKSNSTKSQDTSEELQTISYTCLSQVLDSLGKTGSGKEALTATSNVPQIGQTLSIMLEGIIEGESEAVQLAACSAVESFCKAWPDQTSMSMNFFPGIISALVKVLQPKPSEKRTSRVLIASLKIASMIICKVLGDNITQSLPDKSTTSPPKLDKSWLRATASQVKLAFSNILKLRHSDQSNILRALGDLCGKCLDDCWESLVDSRNMLLETMVIISTRDDIIQLSLRTAIARNDTARDIVQSILYQAVVSLPRATISTDENVRTKAFSQISMLYKLLSEQACELSVVQNILPAQIRDAVVSTIQADSSSKLLEETTDVVPTQEILVKSSKSTIFEDMILTKSSQKHTLHQISQLLVEMSSLSEYLNFAKELVFMLPNSRGNERLALSWIILHILQNSSEYNQGSFMVLGDDDDFEGLLEQFYGYSLQILADEEHYQDWRLQAVALETIAISAIHHGNDFRLELVDCLYPVVQLMGSGNPNVQNHAITCMNILANACGYVDSGDMVVQNADYLVNAVGVRLNTFDLSPKSPLVLIMMVTLAGPSLLPFLDDLVESIFVALESFHGYQKLVELLFMALKAVVEQGVTLPRLSLEYKTKNVNAKSQVSPLTVVDLVLKLRPHISDNKDFQWGAKSESSNLVDDPDEDADTVNQETIPAPKIYTLLLKIAELSQYYLTSSSLQLRIMILSVLKTAIPALSLHQDSFLPLINKLWPVLLPRLQDPEPMVVSGALDTMAEFCHYAGDFMTSRIADAWPEICALHTRYRLSVPRAQLKANADYVKGGPRALIVSNQQQQPLSGPLLFGSDDTSSPKASIWTSLVRLLIAIVNNLTLKDQMSDQLLDMLVPALEKQPEIAQTLQGRNPDAVWLALQRPPEATVEEIRAKLPELTPPYKSKWNFAIR